MRRIDILVITVKKGFDRVRERKGIEDGKGQMRALKRCFEKNENRNKEKKTIESFRVFENQGKRVREGKMNKKEV